MRKKPSITLCKTIDKLSRQVWRDVGDSHEKGYSLGEESITDYFILNLARMHPQGIRSWKFNHWEESHLTGADWEWWIGSNSGWYGLLVQAKRIYLYQNNSIEKYESLPHSIGNTGKLQVDLLIEDAKRRGLYPLYCFYNYLRNPQIKPILCSDKRPDRRAWGCTVASAHAIKTNIYNKKISVNDIFPQSRLLTCLFCPSTPQDTDDLSTRVRRQVENMHALLNIDRPNPAIRQTPPQYIASLINDGSISEDAINTFRLQHTKILVTQDIELQST